MNKCGLTHPFFRADSAEDNVAGAGATSLADRGVVSVRFRPERARVHPTLHSHVAGAYPKGGLLRSQQTSYGDTYNAQNVATFGDFKQAGADPNKAGQECIGRSLGSMARPRNKRGHFADPQVVLTQRQARLGSFVAHVSPRWFATPDVDSKAKSFIGVKRSCRVLVDHEDAEEPRRTWRPGLDEAERD